MVVLSVVCIAVPVWPLRVLELKKLTPRVVNMFKDTGWELVEHQIAALHLQDLPAFAPTPANPWLGDQRLI
ncbi:hypothetical protein DUNSADRAFT_5212 [Dunaliella salina]|uniref:Encoded protein n=1 Tax=Dunaliella salina TaxID=3046 RepID=A0ABQ7GQQ1_DUNSA|nr:hypothetical protein DUNSADRAFT_5212 [Dunaliella salina]|eukprot:KAF5836935.1 hypothetical protein DUNSADRAFT_5212 [Dunaliella salina]